MSFTWEWVDPDGATTALWVEYDVKGIFAPPAVLTGEVVPGQPGQRFREVRHDAREFTLPLYLYNDDEDPSPLHGQIRDLVHAMDPVRGEGRLRVTTPLGDTREMGCRAVAGLDITQTLGEGSTPRVQRAAVVFRALDPYWYATSDVISPEYTTGVTATFFPILPIRLSSSEVFADLQVENTGDLDTWPVWEVTGPASDPVFRNLTTDKTLTLSGLTLVAGEVATVDTRPGYKTIYRQDGVNLFGYAVGSLWSLAAGNNAVRIEMGGAAADVSKLRLTYRPRWLTA